MRWITASKLEEWARTIGLRVELGAVLADLIRASAPDVAAMRFPSGDKGQVRGFDGHLLAQTASMNVPAGRSVWEFGTEEQYRSKLLRDFRKRSGEVAPADQQDITLVLVTPWTWDSSRSDGKLEDWIAERDAEASWKDIHVLDGSALETWFDACPGAAAWHARNTFRSVPPAGVRSTDEYWSHFAGQFRPVLTEEVLLCERSDLAQRVVTFLAGAPDTLSMVADSPDEVIAFAVAAIRKSEPAMRLFLEARTLVIDEVAAGRQLIGHDKLAFLVRNDAARSPNQFAGRAPTLVPLGRQQRNGTGLLLARPSGQALAGALRTTGLGENEATTLSRGSGRSLAALARLMPGGASSDPDWVAQGEELLPLILAGAWDTASDLDRSLIEELADGRKYDDQERALRRFLNDPDPPFDREGAIWTVRAPMDAFVRIGHLVDRAQAERLKAAMVKVFSHIEENHAVDDVVVFPRPKTEHYSDWLRQGLATTVLLLAVWSSTAWVDLAPGSGQTFADGVLEAVPNLGHDHRLMERLRAELPLLAEAAPRPFLSALEFALEGEGAALRPLFQEKEGLLAPTSRLTGLLWALETVAWDPMYFHRSVLLLARLAAMDPPGGRTGNRPIRSLAEIFLLWNPNTNAPLEQRLAALDAIVGAQPAVGWQLLRSLLPQLHGISIPTAKPKLREGGAADRAPISRAEYQKAQTAVVQRTIAAAGEDVERWCELVDAIANFAPSERASAVSALKVLLPKAKETQRERLWTALREMVAKHERFPTAHWVLSPSELTPLKALVSDHAPKDPVVSAVWIFERWTLDDLQDEAAAAARRAETVRKLRDEGGDAAVVRLGVSVRLPHLVAQAVESLELDEDSLSGLFEAARAANSASPFVASLAGVLRRHIGAAAAEARLQGLVAEERISAESAAAWLLTWPDRPETWSAARRLGIPVEQAYWSLRSGYHNKTSGMELYRALLQLLKHGRAAAALESVGSRTDHVSSRLMLRLLHAAVAEVNARPDRVDHTMLGHYVERVLAALDLRTDVPPVQIAAVEFALLPMLRFGGRRLRLHELMAQDQTIWAEFLALLYRPADEPARELNEVEQARARLAYELLSDFKTVPGASDDDIDQKVLTHWIDGARAWGAETKRADIVDSYIGRILAHAAPDPDGGWPHRAVREQIDRIASKELEDGIRVERFNMRGVHTRELYAGGQDEREFARVNADHARIAAAWPRTASLLTDIAEEWTRWAEQEDQRAAQMLLRS